MNQEQEKLMIEGIKLLINESNVFIEDKVLWLSKYNKVFPKIKPFGGAINKEDD